MSNLKSVKTNSILKCVSKHASSTKKITIGNTYEVVSARVRSYLDTDIKICSYFYIVDDEGNKAKFDANTKSFLIVEDIYSTEQVNLMLQFANEIEYMISLSGSLEKAKNDPLYEEGRVKKAKEYLQRIKLNK